MRSRSSAAELSKISGATFEWAKRRGDLAHAFKESEKSVDASRRDEHKRSRRK